MLWLFPHVAVISFCCALRFPQKEAGLPCGMLRLNFWIHLQPSGTHVALTAGGSLTYRGCCHLCWCCCALRWSGMCAHCLRCHLQPWQEGVGGREETGVSVTEELFQLSSEPQDDPGLWHESCCWQTPMWVQTSREEPGLEGQGDTWAQWTRPYWYLARTRWLRDISKMVRQADRMSL